MVEMTIEGNTGTAEIKWIPENKWSVAHYEAFISVPFQNAKWTNLFVYDEKQIEEAKEKARQYLEMALSRCTLC